MHPFSLTAKLATAAFLGALTLSPLPAVASEPILPSPLTQPGPTAEPSVPAAEAKTDGGEAGTADTAPTADPVPAAEPTPAPSASSSEAVTPKAVTPAPATADAVPPKDGAASVASPSAADALRGRGNAHMGQGLERISATGNAQVAAPLLSQQSSTDQFGGLAATWRPAGIQGMDVSSHQGYVDWATARAQGSVFAYVKATEGTGYVNPFYSDQYGGAAAAGMIRGAYHFAIPTTGSSGAEQATYFVRNGGGWSADGRTLPPLLDIEYNPYPSLGNSCYNMSAAQMVAWLRDFSSTVRTLTGRVPMIYTTTDWWATCTGNSGAFADHPLHIAAYGQTSAGLLPNGWSSYAVWQYSSTGPFVGDSNVWRGTAAELSAFAVNSQVQSVAGVAGPLVTAAAKQTPDIGNPTSSLVCGISEGGCYQNYQYGQVHWTKATGAHATQGAVNSAWGKSGWEKGTLGYPVTDLTCGLKNSGCVQSFQKGNIYWTPLTGAALTLGAIDGTWSSLGRENSKLGYPTANEACGLVDGGCYQNFQGGQIHWSAASGASATWGAFGRAWGQTGWEKGSLGYPTDNEVCGLVNGGCYQNFQGGKMHRSSATGAYITSGTISAAWGASGWEQGRLGYPTSNAICGLVNGGCLQTFQKGNIYTSPASGTAITAGAIDSTWSALSREKGKLGYPTTNEVCGLTNGGCYQNFQGGQIHWSPTTGANPTYGTIGAAWRATGWETGTLGYPTSGEICALTNGGCYQNFQKGQIHWSPTTGAYATRGVINSAWGKTRWEAGTLGYPTSNQACGLVNGGCYQNFQGGQIHWSPTTGAHPTSGAIGAAWRATGWEKGTLGYPTTNETCSTTTKTCTQKFQKGQLTWTPTRGVTRS
ncbi:GH25 family lysozyme [Arthrobacter burdickii]|uniref:Lysozyme n=1 Tax=Arthrobacter burdickii TaxID=3035920 RepID=A0ABT8K0U9_9MICC|nr:GH25 family lysozyme [Arthrobacter burdickii]MDN4611058.1 GH25 family lysozyme [Arthrobacter burdickii]